MVEDLSLAAHQKQHHKGLTEERLSDTEEIYNFHVELSVYAGLSVNNHEALVGTIWFWSLFFEEI